MNVMMSTIGINTFDIRRNGRARDNDFNDGHRGWWVKALVSDNPKNEDRFE